MKTTRERNLSLLADFYQYTMAGGFLKGGVQDTIAYYELYYRRVPENGGFAIAAGLEQFVDYIQNLNFTDEDIVYFESKGIFSQEFLDYMRDFKFECDVWAVPEGRVVFPSEPILIVRGPVIQAQIIETMALLLINHQSLIATKANRVVRAAQGRTVMEFGSRRAHGADAATLGARAAYIGGVDGSANTLADRDFGVPALGTMAHSWVQLFDTEYEAFKTYAQAYPSSTTLLVDTYDTLRSGVPNAIKVFDEVIVPQGYRPRGIRLDSGDLAYLSKESRKLLDAAGYEDCKIVASSGLDEYKVSDLILQGAKIDSFGVGERLITSRAEPVFGGVYKLVAVEKDSEIIPRIKVSENVAKITTPGFKTFYRLYDRETGKAEADLITLHDEVIDDSQPLEIFHPVHTWKRKTLENFKAENIMVKVFDGGKLVYDLPSLEEIRDTCKKDVDQMWEEVKRFEYPHQYIVDLSLDLWTIKDKLLKANGVEGQE